MQAEGLAFLNRLFLLLHLIIRVTSISPKVMKFFHNLKFTCRFPFKHTNNKRVEQVVCQGQGLASASSMRGWKAGSCLRMLLSFSAFRIGSVMNLPCVRACVMNALSLAVLCCYNNEVNQTEHNHKQPRGNRVVESGVRCVCIWRQTGMCRSNPRVVSPGTHPGLSYPSRHLADPPYIHNIRAKSGLN